MVNKVRSGADEVRAALTEKLRTDFDFTQVSGLTEDPAVTQNPTRFTPEPYIYLYSVGQTEVDMTKDDSSFEYQVNVEVCTRYRSYRGGQRQANEMLDQVLNILRGKTTSDFPNITQYGYQIYKTVTGDINDFTFKERGANYYKVICPLYVTAQHLGMSDTQPNQQAIYTYSNWQFMPTARVLERWDSGNIFGATTYLSNNNGWNFDTVTYTLGAGSEGSLNGHIVTVDSDDEPITVMASLDYEFGTDTSRTTTITDTDTWTRIRSLRYGAFTPVTPGTPPVFTDDTDATTGVRNLSSWVSSSRFINFGDDNPTNEQITIVLQRNDYPYIVVDANVTLAGITDDVFGTNVISQFARQDVGGYGIYLGTIPAVRDGATFNYTLTTT